MTSKPSQRCRVVSWDQTGWLLKEWGRAAPEIAGVPAVQTHCHQGLMPTPATGEVMPPSPLWTLRIQSSDRKLAQNMRFSHPVGVAGLSSFRTTSGLGHRERSNRDRCSEWYYVFFPFKIRNHSGTLGHADIEAPAWQSSCHSISQWHRLGVLLLGLEQVNDPRMLGSFSDLKRSSRVNILFPSTCSFPWFS